MSKIKRLPKLLVLASAFLFFYGFFIGGVQLVVADVAANYRVGTAGMGMLVSAQYLAAVIAPVLGGALADRVGKKPVLLVSALIFGVGCALAGFSGALWIYISGVFLVGVGYSIVETLATAVLSDLDESKSFQYINITQALFAVGAIISPILIRFCTRYLGANWRLVFFICSGAFFLMAAICACIAFPPARRAKEGAGERGKGAFFASGVFICLFLAIFLYVGLENGFGYFIDSMLTARGDGMGAYAISAYWSGIAICRFLCGTRRYRAGRMLRICFAFIALLFGLVLLAEKGIWVVALAFLLGLAYGPVWSTLMGCAAERFPERSGSAIGLMSTGCALGGIVYPALTGSVAEHFSFQIAFGILAVTALVGMLLCFSVREK